MMSGPSRPSRDQRPASEIVDFAYLARETAGDEELARELLALFGEQGRDIGGRLTQVADARTRRELIHKLKGSAAAIGAVAVTRAAQACEAALADAGGGDMAAPLDALQAALAQTLATIEAHLAQRSA